MVTEGVKNARELIRTARDAENPVWVGVDDLYRLVEDLADALEKEIEVSDALRKTVKAYLAADKFRD